MPFNYIKINSKERESPAATTPAKFTIVSNNALSQLSLKSISLPLTYHNVAAGINNKVYFTDTAPRVATLSPGFYTIPLLLTQLAAAMTSASGSVTYTCAIDDLTQLLTVTGTGVFAFTFSNTIASAAEVLGFANVDNVTASLTQRSSSILNLATTTSFNIVVNDAAGTQSVTGANSCSFVIPALANSFAVQEYIVPDTMPQTINFTPTRQLTIGIYDDNHRLLNFCSNWYMMCTGS
jgi:hypothetical protein